jgi:hypothetical protein
MCNCDKSLLLMKLIFIPAKCNIICIEDLIHEIFTVGDKFKYASNFLWPFKVMKQKYSQKAAYYYVVCNISSNFTLNHLNVETEKSKPSGSWWHFYKILHVVYWSLKNQLFHTIRNSYFLFSCFFCPTLVCMYREYFQLSYS